MKGRFKVIGLMSGTSADGVDAALVEIWEEGSEERIRLAAFETFPYRAEVRREIEAARLPSRGRVDRISQLNFLLGEIFAQSAASLVKKAGLTFQDIDLMGYHGQTIQHLPTPLTFAGTRVASTLQLGEPSVIAQRTGVTTVADFRPRDMAAGGCGAPLIPYFHHLVFKDAIRSRLVVNIGGIANLTYIPAGSKVDDLTAFDTGPGNCLLDQVMWEVSGGKEDYDAEGMRAQAGRVDERLLRKLLSDPFIRRTPPKSTGIEHFNLRALKLSPLSRLKLSPEDLMATLTAFTAHAIADNIRQFVLPKGEIDQVAVGGGGVKNRTMLTSLKVLLAPLRVCTFDELGVSSEAAEAEGFALLAYLTIRGKGGNIPGATGAEEQVPLGKIIPGRLRPKAVLEIVRPKP